MNVRQLECFAAAGKHLSFSKAAEELYLTQPSMTYQISQLEKELGFPLFRRSAHGVQLTEAGAVYYQGVKKILSRLKNLQMEAESAYAKAEKTLMVAHYCKVHENLFPDMLGAYSAKNSDVRAKVRFPDMYEELWDEADAVVHPEFTEESEIYRRVQENYASAILYETKVYCLMHRQHPLAARDALGLKDIERYSILLPHKAVIANLASSHGRALLTETEHFKILHIDTPLLEEIRMRVIMGEDWVALSRGIHTNLPKDMVQIPLMDGDPCRCMLSWRREKPLAEDFAAFMLEYYRENYGKH